MEISSLANTSVFKITSLARQKSAVGKLSLPVDSSQVIYSRYKHVHGTPSLKDGTGLPLSSLRAMDNLIDRLIALKGRNTYWAHVEGMNGEDINFQIEQLQKELNRRVSGTQPSILAGSEQNDLGLVLNLLA